MLIETKNFIQIMSNNWAFINFIFFISENFQRIQSKVFKVKTFLIYLQLWIWNFAHFFSYIKIKKNVVFSSIRVFCRQPDCRSRHLLLLDATQKRSSDAVSAAARAWWWRRGRKKGRVVHHAYMYMQQQQLSEHEFFIWQK